MARFLKSRSKAKGAAPGSLVFIGRQKMDANRIHLMKYNNEEVIEEEFQDILSAFKAQSKNHINWLNIDGLHNTELIHQIGRHFNISELALDNVLNTGQRAKFFEDKGTITIVAKQIEFDQKNKRVYGEQISFVIGENFLVTFQEEEGDQFDLVRNRIKDSIGNIRSQSSDYLAYSLLDSLVDNYHIDIEIIGNEIEKLEPRLDNPNKKLSKEIYHLKTEMAYLLKNTLPMKGMLTRLLRSQSNILKPENDVYFQELLDLTEQSQDAAEMFMGLLTDQINIFNTNVSNRQNDVMKILTIYSSLFIPLTFIVGVYGMNFDVMPELHYKYGYFFVMLFMALVSIAMLMFFRRKRWL